MLTLPLEPTDDRANPIFKDAAACAQWLSQLQLTNLQLAHSKLLTQISELNRYPMRGLERLNTLELLRDAAGYVQDEQIKKLTAKPLPLNATELAVFLRVIQLWQAIATGYQRGLQDYLSGDKSLVPHGALLCQRCLFYSGQQIFEHLRAGYEFSPVLWRQLHELYAFAEQQGIHQTAVTDLPGNPQTSCHSSYVKTLLACYANPVQMTRWQVQLMDRWLSAWSAAISVACHCSLSKNDAQPLAVDLSGTQGLQRVAGLPQKDTLRYLAMVPLSKLLRVKTILLQQGQTPLQVGLGDQQDSLACLEFLTVLHKRWCENQRSCERRPASLHTEISFSFDGIYAQLTGQPLPPNDGATQTESWLIVNESIMGAGLIRDDPNGVRIRCEQLLALHCDKTPSCILGAVAWAKVMLNGRLQIGARFLPGRPEAVRISASTTSMLPAPAFLLPAMPDIRTPASLVIPRDWFEAGREIEVLHQNGKVVVVRLGFSVEHGLDYQRVSFTILNPES